MLPVMNTTATINHTIPASKIEEFLQLLLNGALSIETIIEKLQISAVEAARWLRESQVLQAIKDFAALAEARATLLATSALSKALNALTNILRADIESPKHAETMRKAASSIIRLHQTFTKPPTPATKRAADISTPTNDPSSRATDLEGPASRSVPPRPSTSLSSPPVPFAPHPPLRTHAGAPTSTP